jgi:hypothetical protein
MGIEENTFLHLAKEFPLMGIVFIINLHELRVKELFSTDTKTI